MKQSKLFEEYVDNSSCALYIVFNFWENSLPNSLSDELISIK